MATDQGYFRPTKKRSSAYVQAGCNSRRGKLIFFLEKAFQVPKCLETERTRTSQKKRPTTLACLVTFSAPLLTWECMTVDSFPSSWARSRSFIELRPLASNKISRRNLPVAVRVTRDGCFCLCWRARETDKMFASTIANNMPCTARMYLELLAERGVLCLAGLVGAAQLAQLQGPLMQAVLQGLDLRGHLG